MEGYEVQRTKSRYSGIAPIEELNGSGDAQRPWVKSVRIKKRARGWIKPSPSPYYILIRDFNLAPEGCEFVFDIDIKAIGICNENAVDSAV